MSCPSWDEAVLTTAELRRVTGLSHIQLQNLELAGAIRPRVRGRIGRGNAARWGIMTAVGCAFHKSLSTAGVHPAFKRAACAWVSRQHPGPLHEQFAKGYTVLFVQPGGSGVLLRHDPAAEREEQLLSAWLDLCKCYWRTLDRVVKLLEEKARAAKAK